MIRPMVDNDWERVSEIYKQGMEGGTATFNTECPSFEEWDKGHIKECRFVYEEDGNVIGWVAISPTSSRCVYKGCVEMSIYVDQNYRGHGVGTALVKLRSNGKLYSGNGISTDIIGASIRAYLNAINKIVYEEKQEKKPD